MADLKVNQAMDHRMGKLMTKLNEAGIRVDMSQLAIASMDEWFLIAEYRAYKVNKARQEAIEWFRPNKIETVYCEPKKT